MTVNDWNSFPERFAKSTNNDEQYFYQLLVKDVLPKVIPVIEENEKIQKKHEAIASRKRSSRLIVREIEALEKQQQIEMDLLNDKSGKNEEKGLSRSEKRRLEKEKQEKERKAKEREERLLERERKQLEKLKSEEQAAEKARLEREKRLQRRTGGDEIEFLNHIVPMDNNNDNEVIHHQGTSSAHLQHNHHENNMKTKKSTNKKSQKIGKDQVSGKRKRGRKPKDDLLQQQQQYENEESWVFNCVCGLFGNNLVINLYIYINNN